MKNRAFALSLLLSGSSMLGTAHAQSAEITRPNTIEISTDQQHLSNGSADWTEQAVRWNHMFAPRQQFDITTLQSSRFGLRDDQTLASYSHPLSDKLGVTVDASLSSSHQFLPRNSTGLLLQYEFAPAWIAYGGLKTTSYDTTTVTQTPLMVEHYFSSFSVLAAWRPTRAFDTNTSSTELRANYYYGDKNFVGLMWASGQEATSVSPTVLAMADIWSLALVGRHFLNESWALTYALNTARYGNFYNRDGIRVGVQYLF